jgi:hypothetical protein
MERNVLTFRMAQEATEWLSTVKRKRLLLGVSLADAGDQRCRVSISGKNRH